MRPNLRHTLPAVVMAGILATLAGAAQAEVTLNAGARLSNDNNVNGSPDTPNKTGQRSDNYLALNASAVYFTPINDAQTSYFIGQVGAMTAAYNKYNNLDSSMLVASAGIYKQLSSSWSAQVTGRGFSRYTRQTTRDSTGFGGTFEIKKQLSKTVWVKGVLDYEDNKASLSTFSSTGKTYGVNLGYLPFKDTFINLGYSHNNRDFNSTLPFRTSSQTLFIEGSQRLAKNWYLNGGYAQLKNDSNYAGTAYTNHIVSIGVSFSY